MRWLGLILLALSIAGCGAARQALPYSSSAMVDPMSMTVEQYAISRASLRQAATPCRNPSSKVPDPRGPHGLYVWLYSVDQAKNQPEILKYLPRDPSLCGASIVVLWSGVDRGPKATPRYDFQAVENAIAPWAKVGKPVNLLFAGVNELGPDDTATPAWVLAQTGANKVDLVPCRNPGDGSSAGPPTPVYWEQGYSRPWHDFIGAVISAYGKDPRIGYMRFGIGAGAEDFPQHGADANCFGAWAKYGLSAHFWAEFSSALVETIARLSAKNNARVQQLVALNPLSDPKAPYDVAGAVGHVAAAHGVGFGTENLGSGNYGTLVESCVKNVPIPYWCGAFNANAGSVPLQFQPISYTLNPAFPKLAPLPKLLPYAIDNHAQIFELYPQEWLTADDPAWTGYAGHHAAWRKALDAAAAALGTGSESES